MSEDIPCSCRKDVTLFQKGQIIGLHQAKKTTKEIVETTKTGLRTVQRIFKNLKDYKWSSSSRKKCGQKKSLMTAIGIVSWNQMVKKINGGTYGYV